jgi:hypothetical protein
MVSSKGQVWQSCIATTSITGGRIKERKRGRKKEISQAKQRRAWHGELH